MRRLLPMLGKGLGTLFADLADRGLLANTIVCDQVALRQDLHPLQHVGQLAHVARPAVRLQRPQRLGAHRDRAGPTCP
jgi:hypothetical protein